MSTEHAIAAAVRAKQPKIAIQGYVIQNVRGSFLAHNLVWIKWDSPEKAFVHPIGIIDWLRVNSNDWEIKPTLIFPAYYTPEEGTVLTTEQPFPFTC